jgi:hypothetical protein
MHYRRLRATGTTQARVWPTAEQRFFAKVKQAGECWEWTGARGPTGYGYFNSGDNTPTVAHRWCYEFMVGPIPDGLHLDHLCRNEPCVNPAHLDPVTPAVNLQRGLLHHSHRPCCPDDARERREMATEIRRLRKMLTAL